MIRRVRLLKRNGGSAILVVVRVGTVNVIGLGIVREHGAEGKRIKNNAEEQNAQGEDYVGGDLAGFRSSVLELVRGDEHKRGNDQHYGGTDDASEPGNGALLVVTGSRQEVVGCDNGGYVDNKDGLPDRRMDKVPHVRFAVLNKDAPAA